MSLNIKNEETHQLARELVQLTGETMTGAAGVELVPVTQELKQAARLAWRRYGKGNHPAGLNFGDCFAYALAEVGEEALLFKGEDFALTDVKQA